jgi:hypothetical protein
MNVIDKIEDFNKIEVGYTFFMMEKGLANVCKILKIIDEKVIYVIDIDDGLTFEIDDLFANLDIFDVVLPCSPEESKLFFPEYFI